MVRTDDPDYDRGNDLFQSFVRGDALIGLVADVPGAERSMMDALWAAATRGSADAYRLIGDCYLAALRTIGAFEGISPEDAKGRCWSADAEAIVDGDEALQVALRAYFEAARLGHREAAMRFARVSRGSSEGNRRRALALLESLDDPMPAEIYQRGLVQNWLSDLPASAASHTLAAERGDADAQFELYIYYAQGLGVPKDLEAAQAWLERAAEGNHPRALYNVGAAWASGARGQPDMKKAAAYYARAAEHGNGRAAATLAVMMLTGEVDGTRAEAIARLEQADESGFPTWELLDAAGIDDPRESDDA